MSTLEQSKIVMDGVSLSTVVGALMGWLPAIAALLTIVWTAIRIWETKTIQNLISRFTKE